MAQRRSGQALAQTINRLYSMTEASMRIEPRSVLVAESSAVAVWVDLWIDTDDDHGVRFPFRSMDGGSAVDNPTSSTSHSSLWSRLSRVTPRTQTGGGDTPDKSHPDCGRQNVHESFLPACYDTLWAAIPVTCRDTHISRNVHYNYHRPRSTRGGRPPAAYRRHRVTNVRSSYT